MTTQTYPTEKKQKQPRTAQQKRNKNNPELYHRKKQKQPRTAQQKRFEF